MKTAAFKPVQVKMILEPPRDKTNKVAVRPAKTQVSLGIRPVWSESSLCAQWVAKDPSFLYADSEDWSDWADARTDLSLRWAHMPFCGFCHEAAHLSHRRTAKTQNRPIRTIVLILLDENRIGISKDFHFYRSSSVRNPQYRSNQIWSQRRVFWWLKIDCDTLT